jgi:hypothetical protein
MTYEFEEHFIATHTPYTRIAAIREMGKLNA